MPSNQRTSTKPGVNTLYPSTSRHTLNNISRKPDIGPPPDVSAELKQIAFGDNKKHHHTHGHTQKQPQAQCQAKQPHIQNPAPAPKVSKQIQEKKPTKAPSQRKKGSSSDSSDTDDYISSSSEDELPPNTRDPLKLRQYEALKRMKQEEKAQKLQAYYQWRQQQKHF